MLGMIKKSEKSLRLLKMCQGQGFSVVEQNHNFGLLNFKYIVIPQSVKGMSYQHCVRCAASNSDNEYQHLK